MYQSLIFEIFRKDFIKDSKYWDVDVQILDIEIEEDAQSYYKFIARTVLNQQTQSSKEYGALHGSPPFFGQTQAGDRFVRYSAFRNDFRIGHDGSTVAGTYATSRRNAEFVTSGLHARGRYALPNPVPPVHVFEIMPPPGTNVQYGTVDALHGQSGGGVEVEFTDPLPPGSVVYKGTQSIW